MPTYRFYDTDYDGIADYDITGEAYRILLNTCFKYAHTVALHVSPNYQKDLSCILPYQIPVTEAVHNQYSVYSLVDVQDHTILHPYTIMHFVLSPEVKTYLYKQTDHLWGWTFWHKNNNPDDPCFFRKDESVFFSSVIHDGVCTLYPQENEDVSEILKDSRWILSNTAEE